MNEIKTIDEFIEALGWGKLQWRIGIIVGLLFMADGIKVVLMSILGPQLLSIWRLTPGQLATISSSVFAGMATGSLIFGKLADTYGRQKIILASAIFACCYSFMSSASPNYVFFLITRTTLGLFVANNYISLTYAVEYIPLKYRAKSILTMESVWCIGMFTCNILGIMILNNYSWRVFIAVAAIPSSICAISLLYTPESIRFYLAKGDNEKMNETIQNICKINNRQIENINIELLMEDTRQSKRGSYLELFSSEFRRTSICLALSIFSGYVVYYGLVFLQPMVMYKEAFQATDTCWMVKINSVNYWALLIPSAAEIIWVTNMLPILCDKFGRKIPMVISQILLAIILCLFLHTGFSEITSAVLFVIVRVCATGIVSITSFYVGELYPTRIRGVAYGFTMFGNKIGSICAPLISQALYMNSSDAAVLTLSLFSLISAGSVYFIKKDTSTLTNLD